ncbi:MAG TPA: heme exporter protein CcmD [Casimicrobiaceae bacterium]|nr:heme exporter protein CcmD [Casimicrobiaceae bacterium]
MNHWDFVIVSYAITAIVIVAEIVAVVLRQRAARSQ